jgi:hypothetical protein
MSWSRLHLADVHRGDHRSKLVDFCRADDQDHLVDLPHHGGAGQVSIMVATIMKASSSAQIDYAARQHGGSRQDPRSSPHDQLINWESVTHGPAWESRLAPMASTCLAPLLV